MPGGSRKGIPNRATEKARQAFAMLVDNTAPRLAEWLEQVYEQEGPNEAIKRFLDMAEYVMPRKARVEHTGEDGGPVMTADVSSDKEVIERFLKQNNGGTA